MSRPLAGILVADFSRVLAGPSASMMLADLGARVIKVERPGSGDDTRGWGPPWSPTGATYFESVNRNKESVALDLSDPADQDLAIELATRADVLLENFKPGTMDGLGLGYEALRVANPALIYASVSGFGSAGGADLPGYDFVVQAVGGLMSVTGEVGGTPVKAGVAVVDILTGKDAAIGVLAALVARAATGVGSRVEVNLLSSLQTALSNQAQAWLGAGKIPQAMGNAHPSVSPYESLQCSDTGLAVAAGNDGLFLKFTTVLGVPELAVDERFSSNSGRVTNRPELVPLLEAALASGTAAEWQSQLSAVGVPAGEIATIDKGFELAESLGLEPTIEVHDPEGAVTGRQVRHPVTWTPPLAPRGDAPPALDQHGEAVRAWLAAPA